MLERAIGWGGRCVLWLLPAVACLFPATALACVNKVEHRGLAVEIVCERFDATRHQLTRRVGTPLRIDGREAWGTKGRAPDTFTKALRVTVGAAVYSVPAALLRDLYDPRLAPRHPAALSIQKAGDVVSFRFTGGNQSHADYEAFWMLDIGTRQLTRLVYAPPGSGKPHVSRARL
jgi:hypothetical protein